MQADECVDILLQDLAQENIALSNLGSYLPRAAEAFANRTQGNTGLAHGIAFMRKISTVCAFHHVFFRETTTTDHRTERAVHARHSDGRHHHC